MNSFIINSSSFVIVVKNDKIHTNAINGIVKWLVIKRYINPDQKVIHKLHPIRGSEYEVDSTLPLVKSRDISLLIVSIIPLQSITNTTISCKSNRSITYIVLNFIYS